MNPTSRRWASRIAAILLLLAAGVVVLGVTIESSAGHSETSGSSVQTEGSPSHEELEAHPGEVHAGPGFEGATFAGIPVESPLFVGSLAAASFVLAVAIWVRPGRVTGILTIAFSIAASAFDLSEIHFQATNAATGLLALAVTVVVLRVVTIVAGVLVIRTPGARAH